MMAWESKCRLAIPALRAIVPAMKVSDLIPLVFLLSAFAATAQETTRLKVGPEGRYLFRDSGEPFFYLGDTAWELFHRLNREEADHYLENRAAKGFTVIQAVALAELDGLNTPNAYGHRPLVENDPARPDVKDGPANDYWDHVDHIVNKAESLGLHVGMLPTWGDKWQGSRGGIGPVVFNNENARTFGEWLGRRYADKPIIWILGGDRNILTKEERATIEAMALGLRAGDGGRHLITFHPRGPSMSSAFFHDAGWLDFNMSQSSHAARDHDNGLFIEHDYSLTPAKPTLDGEPRYERIPVGFYMRGSDRTDRFDAYDVRQAAWWALTAGAAGHTYGNNSVWQMWDEEHRPMIWADTSWRDALDDPGASQMQHARALFEKFPFHKLRPNSGFVVDGPQSGGAKVRGILANDGTFGFVYTPRGEPFTVNMGLFSGVRVKTSWFDPRDGSFRELYTGDNVAFQTFTPPSTGRGNDWVLVLDSFSD